MTVALVCYIPSESLAECFFQSLSTHQLSSPPTMHWPWALHSLRDPCPCLLPHVLHFLLIPIRSSSRSLCKHTCLSQQPPITHPDHLKSWNFIQGLYRLTPTQSSQHSPKTTCYISTGGMDPLFEHKGQNIYWKTNWKQIKWFSNAIST